jgi:4-diphosphocytidyl-2-C-methyl-D-erythritol kinase
MRHTTALVKAPAKVNLQLSVGPRQDDGYHNLVTVFQALSLYDDVRVRVHGTLPQSKTTNDVELIISLSGSFTHGVPIDESNLAAKAARLILKSHIAQHDEIDLPEKIYIDIKKEIPTAGGMAGGSADGAAVLLALDAIYNLGLSRNDLEKLAAQLGSDLPFVLTGGVAIGRGRGDEITPALTSGTFQWVLALSNQGLSTPQVYQECDRLREGLNITLPDIHEELMLALRSGDAQKLGSSLTNDLQSAALSLKPALRLTLEVGREYGALGCIVSGSGPTIAFLVENEEKALDLTVALSSSGVVAGVARAHGPVPGAKVVELY